MKQQIITLLTGLSGLLIFIFSGCNTTEKKEEKKETPVTHLDTISLEPPQFETTYRLDSITSKQQLDSLKKKLFKDEAKIVYALNRIDEHRLRPGMQLLIPDSLANDLNLYSPFPKHLNPFDSIAKTVLIAKRIQAFALYENGDLLRWGPVSTGKQTTGTPSGLFYGNYKAKRKISTIDASWIMPYYFNFMNFEGVGTHQYTLPGYPASHGCVRMYLEDAKFIYHWADMWQLEDGIIVQNGTPFMVIGEYDSQSLRPWYRLADNKQANDLSTSELDTLSLFADRYQSDPLNNTSEAIKEAGAML